MPFGERLLSAERFSVTLVQIPEALWPRAHGAIREYRLAREAGEGTPEWEHGVAARQLSRCTVHYTVVSLN